MATLTGAGCLLRRAGRGWFEFDVVGAADSGAYQTLKLAGERLPDPDNFKVTLENFDNPNGNAAAHREVRPSRSSPTRSVRARPAMS